MDDEYKRAQRLLCDLIDDTLLMADGLSVRDVVDMLREIADELEGEHTGVWGGAAW